MSSADHHARLEAMRASGAHRRDPVRFRLIEAMARRSLSHDGEAARIIAARIARLIESYPAAPDTTQGQAPVAAAPRSSLAELLQGLAQHAGDPGDARAAPSELKTLHRFRSTWARLHADQRLSQSRARVPDQAGPLNSQHLVHRALSLMGELSPAYLDHFMAQVDALSWLEQLADASGPPPKPEAARKTPRTRPPARS